MRNSTRSLLVVTCICISLASVHGQFTAFQDANMYWDVDYYNGPTFIEEKHYTVRIGQDTVIDGLTYMKLFLHLGNWHLYEGAMRDNEEGQVYYYTRNDELLLLYDFNVLPGDTVSDVYILDQPPQDMLVNSVDTVVIAGKARKRIGVQSTGPGGAPGIHHWIQGIGGTGGLLTTVGALSVSASAELGCMSASDTIQFGVSAGQPGNCFILLSNSDVFDEQLPYLYPNPSTTGIFHISTNQVQVQVYNAVGKLVLETNGGVLDLSDFPPGVYNASISLDGHISTVKLIADP